MHEAGQNGKKDIFSFDFNYIDKLFKSTRVHAEFNSVLHPAGPRGLNSAGGLYITLIQNK
jgi:hypothetical protein